MSCSTKIIVALDIEDGVSLENLIAALDPVQCRLKVGITLFTRYGPEWIKKLHAQGFEVFLDLKFHDIPQQVAGACFQAAQLGVWMMNIHALGGVAMLKAAKDAVDRASAGLNQKPLLIGVTLLTSLAADDLADIGMKEGVTEIVLQLARLCFDAGLDGVVCSAQEAKLLKKTFGAKFLCVTPGIRLPEDDKQDQQRIMTPNEAIACGSDYLVIGRSITHAKAPLQVLDHINQNIQMS